ncbi:arginine--tRNA ligase [Flavobacterium rivuli WB 3.3-2 = DSM 21788]|uniref:Arginine--tRNA ligase n=2 Tax=Flavobacterium rivuli TaxID=498301 RepID=A0A0A2LZX6_9FLAO|nr:arginine--tRNA ligase [Flavobacterium rivuli]KGO85574.1 arginine--tRNA ligase [Flavobacterium rivuli WB 3.3-2 = DSM 21788]
MALSQILTSQIQKAATALFDISLEKIELQATRREFEGDITMVIFPLLKLIKGNPAELGNKIGQYLIENSGIVDRFNVVGGFLNIVISDAYYIDYFNGIKADENFGTVAPIEGGKAVMVEFASPNTNKPLHLGHVRNVLLGYSVANIIEASGKKVYKTQVVNDRGIHICKSMLAWEKFGHGETPESTGLKGDKLVGKYYVAFEKELQEQTKPVLASLLDNDFSKFPQLETKISPINAERIVFEEKIKIVLANFEIPVNTLSVKIKDAYQAGKDGTNTFKNILKILKDDKTDEISEKEIEAFEKNVKPIITLEIKLSEKVSEVLEVARLQTPIMKEAQDMLLKWEANDPEVKALWAKMNGWVYKGFEETYKNIGVDFDSYYYESDTYLLGKDVVADGLEKGVFFKKEDGSVWIDLTEDGLDEKLVLRKDGTSVYITQDIGTAIQRVKDFPDVGGMVYTVGNEQDYHFKVLFLILKKLGFDWAANLYHLSYGMVDLPSGKMKSREGTVVDADDLMAEMTDTAQKISEELGKLEGYSDEEKLRLYRIIGLGALKYYILKVDPKKRILFDPKESVDFAGNTGPFIQYTYARIQSLLRRADFDISVSLAPAEVNLHEKEKELLKIVSLYPEVIQAAADSHSPALIANYTYDLVREYNSFYQSVPVLGTEVLNEKVFRIQLSKKVGETIKSAFGLLGIEVPERM